MSPTDAETCSRCGRQLLRSEQACVFGGMIVCAGCDKVLRSKQVSQPAPSPKPVPAPVATEAPHPPVLNTEARSSTTWKCPSCAEEIQKEAQKCRFCGMILTKAAKMGYPAFYENVAKRGLSCTWLLSDYGDFLYPDEGGIDDCCLGAPDMLGCLFDNQDEDQKAKVLKIAGGIVKAMRERLSDIPAESQEALTLRATSKYLWMVRDFARPGHPESDPQTLQFAISHFTELKQTLSPIAPEGRRELEEQLDYAIRACQSQLGTTGRTCSEPSSPALQASQASISDFSFRRDFKRIQWGATLWLNSLRAAAAGIVWCVVFLFVLRDQNDRWQASLCMLMLPLGYLIFLLPIGLLAAFLSQRGLPWLGLVTGLFVLMILPGDPLIFILHKVYPRLVPVQRFGFVNLRLVIFVLRDMA